MGFDVRVQTADARRPELGLTVRVHNVIALREGRQRDAIALVSHYDSSAHSPGGADDGLGVAVSLEAARALVREPLRHALAVIMTDGEELGLMGAAALDRDPVASRLGAYLNLEAVGSGGPAMLFETGPGNAWIVDEWAASAPDPRGGSFALEIYRRIPNDTDFTILKRLGVPGLNFASIADGYAYHTARDTAERVDPYTVAHMGGTAVRLVRALDARDLSGRSIEPATYTDFAGRAALSIGPAATAWLTGIALLAGVIAWGRALRASIDAIRLGRVVLTAVWALIGAAVVLAFMIAAAALLRASREVYHPWYAHPDRLFALTALMGTLGGWAVARVGAILPWRWRGRRHPTVAWAVALPWWIGISALAAYYAPTAAYLFLLPLLVSSVLLLVTPLSRTIAVRGVSLVAFGFNFMLWGWLTLQLLRFAVAHFGRQPIVTPPWTYAALMLIAAVFIVPPALAVLTGRPLRRPGLTTAMLFAGVAGAVWIAWVAPGYTYERPQRRSVRYVHDAVSGRSFWQVGGTEPGLDLAAPPGEWRLTPDTPAVSMPIVGLRHPFVWLREDAASPPAVPARVTAGTGVAAGTNAEYTVSVVPAERALAATFVMPQDVLPLRPNLPGVVRNGRWTARFGAVPPEGVALRAFVPIADIPRLNDLRVVITSARLPGGTGWQGLPSWAPQDRTVWASEAAYILSPLPELAPAPLPAVR
jgi:hypothetical protein